MQHATEEVFFAGDCGACVASDVTFVKRVDTGSSFFVCIACGAAGPIHPRAEGGFIELRRAPPDLAPRGWTAASRADIERAGFAHMIVSTRPFDGVMKFVFAPLLGYVGPTE